MTSASQLTTQRYCANTCTLEITAAASPLSRWSTRTLLKHLRFRLWLQNTEGARLIARGNRKQLEALNTSVHQYLQVHLSRATWPLTRHQVALTANESLDLSTLELFDLAETLDQFEQAAAALPSMAMTQRRQTVPLWASSAVAAGLILAVGLTLRQQQMPIQHALEQAVPDAATPEKTARTPQAEVQAESGPGEAMVRDRPSGAISTSPAETPNQGAPAPQRVLPPSEAIPQTSKTAPQPSIAQMPGSQRSETPAAPRPSIAQTPRIQPSEPAAPQPAPEPAADQLTAPAGRAPSATRTRPDRSGNQAFSSSSEQETSEHPLEEPLTRVSSITDTLTAVKSYFQRRWAELTPATPLTYELQLNPDGTAASLTPLQPESPSLELIPEQVVPPFSSEQMLILQITLYPNGQVEVIQRPRPQL